MKTLLAALVLFGVLQDAPKRKLEDRTTIFAIETRGLPFRASREQLLANLAQQTDGWSGADIHAVCMQARMNALKRADYAEMAPLMEADFLAAVSQLNAPKPESKRLAAV